jgi:hypothetical protein
MKNASANDQVKGAIQLADVQQAHLPKLKVGEAVSVAKTLGMSQAGLGKIDTEDRTIRVIKGDQSRLGGAATGAQYAQVLPMSALGPQLNARKFGVTRQRSPLLQEFLGVFNWRRIAIRLVLLPDRLCYSIFHDRTLDRTDSARNRVGDISDLEMRLPV